MHHPLAVRAVERKGRDGGFERFTVRGDHGVDALHGAVRRVQRTAARVGKGLAGPKNGLLSDDAGAAHLLYMAAAVDDAPVTGAKLPPLQAEIGDFDRVGEKEAALVRRGFLLNESGRDGDADTPGHGRVHRVLLSHEMW